jgi:cytochrome bd ubiquinol oxidase subunit II
MFARKHRSGLAQLSLPARISRTYISGVPEIEIRQREPSRATMLWPVPVVTALTALAAWRWLRQGREVPPFLAAITLFMLGYLGLVISNFPFLVPPSLTVWDTAAARASQIFMLLGTLLLLPFVIGYVGNDLLAVPR